MKRSIETIVEHSEIPYDLLLLADPSKYKIETYLKTGTCFVAKEGSRLAVGAMVLDPIAPTTMEIRNIAVRESRQRSGIGTALLQHAEVTSSALGFKKLVIATGNSSHGQLALYQKEGFKISGIEKDYFVKNYPNPIIENGMQCRHKVLLEKKL